MGAIPADLACIECGYCLRGLSGDGNCPECGRAVRESLVPARYPEQLRGAFQALGWSCVPVYWILALPLADSWLLGFLCVVSALIRAGGVWQLRSPLRSARSLRRTLAALWMLLPLEATLPIILLVLGTGETVAAYAWVVIVAVAAYLIGRIAASVARPVGDERVILQLRGQRALLTAALGSAAFLSMPLFGAPFIVAGALHGVLALVLIFVAVGHTIVALGNLRESLALELLAGENGAEEVGETR